MTAETPIQPLVSVVLPTHNEGDLLRMTVESILAETAFPAYEIVIVDDGSTDGSCDEFVDRPLCRVVRASGLGVAGARNMGAEHAQGDRLVFLDAHCLVTSNWLTRFNTALAGGRVGVVGPCFTRLHETEPKAAGMTWVDDSLQTAWGQPVSADVPYTVPFVPGGCQAFRTAVFRAIGGYEQGFTRWGYEDIEISLRLWLMGFTVLVDPAIVVGHYFRTDAAYEVRQRDLAYNLLRMAHMHLAPNRIRRVIQAIDGIPDLDGVLDDLYATDIMERRTALAATRVRNDDWFFSTFVPHLA
jgi:glycosyltransferase involved in cell wall biosynthesis